MSKFQPIDCEINYVMKLIYKHKYSSFIILLST